MVIRKHALLCFSQDGASLVPGCDTLCEGNIRRLQERKITADTNSGKIKGVRPDTD